MVFRNITNIDENPGITIGLAMSLLQTDSSAYLNATLHGLGERELGNCVKYSEFIEKLPEFSILH